MQAAYRCGGPHGRGRRPTGLPAPTDSVESSAKRGCYLSAILPVSGSEYVFGGRQRGELEGEIHSLRRRCHDGRHSGTWHRDQTQSVDADSVLTGRQEQKPVLLDMEGESRRPYQIAAAIADRGDL